MSEREQPYHASQDNQKHWLFKWFGSQNAEEAHWLLDAHANEEFGRIVIKSRLTDFLASMIAISVMRLPFDLMLWAAFFYLGYKLGVRLFE
jgi:hypothetical protein